MMELPEQGRFVNLTAPFALCRALVPGMVARGHGRLVNIGSVAGGALFDPSGGRAIY